MAKERKTTAKKKKTTKKAENTDDFVEQMKSMAVDELLSEEEPKVDETVAEEATEQKEAEPEVDETAEVQEALAGTEDVHEEAEAVQEQDAEPSVEEAEKPLEEEVKPVAEPKKAVPRKKKKNSVKINWAGPGKYWGGKIFDF